MKRLEPDKRYSGNGGEGTINGIKVLEIGQWQVDTAMLREYFTTMGPKGGRQVIDIIQNWKGIFYGKWDIKASNESFKVLGKHVVVDLTFYDNDNNPHKTEGLIMLSLSGRKAIGDIIEGKFSVDSHGKKFE